MFAIKSFLVDKFLTVWWAVVIVLLALPFGVWLANYSAAASEQTPACYVSNGHNICLESLRRSAQRYWEYRTVISVDGTRQPLELYNCRDRTRTLVSDGSTIPFLTEKTGDWVCQVLKPARAPELDQRGKITIR